LFVMFTPFVVVVASFVVHLDTMPGSKLA